MVTLRPARSAVLLSRKAAPRRASPLSSRFLLLRRPPTCSCLFPVFHILYSELVPISVFCRTAEWFPRPSSRHPSPITHHLPLPSHEETPSRPRRHRFHRPLPPPRLRRQPACRHHRRLRALRSRPPPRQPRRCPTPARANVAPVRRPSRGRARRRAASRLDRRAPSCVWVPCSRAWPAARAGSPGLSDPIAVASAAPRPQRRPGSQPPRPSRARSPSCRARPREHAPACSAARPRGRPRCCGCAHPSG